LEAYPHATFVDVLLNPAHLDEMLKFSDGQRKVPVIVQGGKGIVGYNRGS